MAKVIVIGGKNNHVNPNMGFILANTLLDLEHEVACVMNSTSVFKISKSGWEHIGGLKEPPTSVEMIAGALDKYIEGVDAMHIAIPANPKVELAYIRYAHSHGIYVPIISKGVLSDFWQELKPVMHMVGRYGTVGGRALILPWAKLQQLPGKQFLAYGYLNATVECFFSGDGKSPHEMYDVVKRRSLAEPGSSDYVSCLNIEIGEDYVRKIPILVNEAMAGPDGPFMTSKMFDEYVSLKPEHIREIIRRGQRFAFCISSVPGYMPLDVKKGMPGTLSAEFGGLTILGGFCNPKDDVYLDGWMKGGAKNGLKIVFQDGLNESGQTAIDGEGAGPDTIWSAIINMNEYLASRPAVASKRVDHALSGALGQEDVRVSL